MTQAVEGPKPDLGNNYANVIADRVYERLGTLTPEIRSAIKALALRGAAVLIQTHESSQIGVLEQEIVERGLVSEREIENQLAKIRIATIREESAKRKIFEIDFKFVDKPTLYEKVLQVKRIVAKTIEESKEPSVKPIEEVYQRLDWKVENSSE